MPQFTLNELATNAGSSAANTGINLAKQAKGLACGLYRNYSGWATNLSLPTPPPAAFIKGVWDTICADDPGGLPDPPPPPSGIKCWVFNGIDGHGRNIEIFACGNQAEWRDYYNGNPDFMSPYIDNIHASNQSISVGARRGTESVSQVNSDNYTSGFYSEGSCAPCLNSPAPSPSPNPPPIVAPPPGDLTKNVTINYNDGNIFSIPLTFKQVTNNLDIVVDVGGVGFNFNVDGVSFNWNQNSSSNYINFPGGGSGNGGGGAGGDSNFILNNKLDNITNKIENNLDIKLDDVILDVNLVQDTLDSAQDCCPEPPDPDTQTAIVCPIDDGNTYLGLTGLLSVKLDVTKLPLSSKIQFGNSSPNVLFAGWLSFTYDGQAYEREPIHFQHNIFIPPKGSNGFFYCLTNGAKGRVTYYVKT